MRGEKSFFRTVCTLAIPAALQSLLQSSFSLVDQIMIGQLGAVSVAAVGLAGEIRLDLRGRHRRHWRGGRDHDLAVSGAGRARGSSAELFTNLWLGFGLAGGIHRALPAVPRGDHAGLYGGCADAADGGGLPPPARRDVSAHGRGDNACRGVPLRGKAAAAAVRGHRVRAFEYGPERPPDLREMRLCRHGRDRRRDRDGPFPVGQFPADAPVLPEDAAASRGGRQAHAARARARTAVSGYAAAAADLRGDVEPGRKCLRRDLRAHGHGRQRGHDADRARAGAGDRRAVRPVAGGGRDRRQAAWQRGRRRRLCGGQAPARLRRCRGPRCCPCSWCCSAVSMWRSIRWRTG